MNPKFTSFQEAFDATVEHFIAQKKQARGKQYCEYRTSEGLACAVGCHIPDGHDSLDHLGTFRSLMTSWPELRSLFSIDGYDSDLTADFWSDLQKAHDQSTSPNMLRTKLIVLAKQWKIDSYMVDKITEWEGEDKRYGL